MAYLIRPVSEADLPLLTRWRHQPHVRRWWGEPDVEDEAEKLTDTRIAMWVVQLEDRPLGFIQDYDVHGWTPHPFDYLPAPSRGMDVYIGEHDLMGSGHGTAFIRQHVATLFAQGIRAIGIDPHPDNLAARAAFGQAGFTFRSGPVQTPWSLAVLMDQYAPD